ncbi:hypothetical protein JCM8547_006957 [Rhodosporidiobolus lusitaniae]
MSSSKIALAKTSRSEPLSPPSRFFNVLFSSGGKSRLNPHEEERVLFGKVKQILLDEVRLKLGAVALICCLRSTATFVARPLFSSPREALPSRNAPHASLDGHEKWDYLLSLLYASEIALVLQCFQLPIPGPASRWERRDNASEDPDLDGMFLHAPIVRWESRTYTAPGRTGEKIQLYTPSTFFLLHDPLSPSSLKVLEHGQIIDPSSSSSSAYPSPSAAAQALSTIGGLEGISNSQGVQLRKKTGGMRKIKGAQVMIQHMNGSAGERKEERRKRREEKTREKEGDGAVVCASSAPKATPAAQWEVDAAHQRAREATELLEKVKAKFPTKSVEVRTDAVPPVVSIIVTRPSSPVFLPVDRPSNDTGALLRAKVDKLEQEASRVRKQELARTKDALSASQSANTRLLAQHRLTAPLFSLVERAQPVVEQVWRRVPLPGLVKDYALSKAVDVAEKAIELVEGGKVRADLLVQFAAAAPSSSSSMRDPHLADIPSLSLPSGIA